MTEPGPETSYVHPALERRWCGPGKGYGVFTRAGIARGEILCNTAGRIVTRVGLAQLGELGLHFAYPIDDEHLYIPMDLENPGLEWYMNHSCAGNAGNQDEFMMVAMHDIAAGEEITYDYATTYTDGWDIFGEMPCHCGAPECRGVVKPDDWRLASVQARYRGYFQPNVQRRLDEQHALVALRKLG